MGLVGQFRKLLYTLRGSTRYTRFEALQKMQDLSLEQLRKQQFTQLTQLITHAYTTTKYYKEVFHALGLSPKDIRSFGDYTKLPLLTKEIIQDNLEELCSSSTPTEKRILNFSGGTTGNPASFYQDQNVFSEMDAHWLYMLSLAGWTPDDMIVTLWGNPKELLSTQTPAYVKPWLRGTITLNAYRYDAQTMHMWVNIFKRYKRTILYGYSTVIADFAQYCLDNNMLNLPIFAVMTTAEALSPVQRQCIEKAFSCNVFDQYGAREMPGVASQCAHGHMHLYTNIAYTEFLPLQDAAKDTQNHTRIILTSLTNYTMPMLRYEIGDLGAPLEGTCPCGLGYPLMQVEVGRIGAYLLLPKGGKLYSTMLVRQLYPIKGIMGFQFRQTSLSHVNLFIIRGKNFSAESAQKVQKLIEVFPQNICPGAQLELHYVNELPRTSGGKHRQVVCEVESI